MPGASAPAASGGSQSLKDIGDILEKMRDAREAGGDLAVSPNPAPAAAPSLATDTATATATLADAGDAANVIEQPNPAPSVALPQTPAAAPIPASGKSSNITGEWNMDQIRREIVSGKGEDSR